MFFSNSYFRAFVFGLLMLIGLIGVSYPNHGLGDLSGQRGNIFATMLVVSLAITVALVGTFSRGDKPWPWLKTGVACFACWLATLCVMALLVFVFIKPH